MPWYNGEHPPSYKNQPEEVREKAVEIANALLKEGVEEGIAIATGLKQARAFFKDKKKINSSIMKENEGKQGTPKNHHNGPDFTDRLSDYPDGNVEERQLNEEDIATAIEDHSPAKKRTIGEATDPSKLSDL